MKKKDELDNDNKEKLQDAAQRLGISEEEVLSRVPEGIWIAYIFNSKALGSHLKRMKLDMSQEEVLKQQMADDPVASVVFFNKIQKDSSQQQKVTSSTASCKMPEDDSKKSDEVSNLSTETISIKPLEASSTTSHQESILG